jgi:hypothetical protein
VIRPNGNSPSFAHAFQRVPALQLRLRFAAFCLAARHRQWDLVTFFTDPGKYDYHNCEQLAEQRKTAAERELELKLLIDRAEQAAGGTAVSVIAYQGDYIMARATAPIICCHIPAHSRRRDG